MASGAASSGSPWPRAWRADMLGPFVHLLPLDLQDPSLGEHIEGAHKGIDGDGGE